MSPESCPRQTPAPGEQSPRNKATLQEIGVVFQARYDRMNYQTSQLRRSTHCWMLLVQASKNISQPGQAYKMEFWRKQLILRLKIVYLKTHMMDINGLFVWILGSVIRVIQLISTLKKLFFRTFQSLGSGPTGSRVITGFIRQTSQF